MPWSDRVRVLAIAPVVLHDHLLLGRVEDPSAGREGWRPLGGEIEFGERAADGLRREFREELGREIEIVADLGVAENHYEFRGRRGHEVVFMWVARFAPGHAPDSLAPMDVREGERLQRAAYWLPLAEVLAGTHTLYPDDLGRRLVDWVNRL